MYKISRKIVLILKEIIIMCHAALLTVLHLYLRLWSFLPSNNVINFKTNGVGRKTVCESSTRKYLSALNTHGNLRFYHLLAQTNLNQSRKILQIFFAYFHIFLHCLEKFQISMEKKICQMFILTFKKREFISMTTAITFVPPKHYILKNS